jgi:Zn-dependent alcohol dehydrogenase
MINVLRPESGATIGVFGTGAVGLSAIMAAAVAGCITVVGVDTQFDRPALARELGATHVVNGAETDAVEEIKRASPAAVRTTRWIRPGFPRCSLGGRRPLTALGM